MDYVRALLAIGVVALPLVAAWGAMEWQSRRRARARKKRSSNAP